MFLDATRQAALVRSGEVSPDELVEQAIATLRSLPRTWRCRHPSLREGTRRGASRPPTAGFGVSPTC
jgi:hypothetical protein